MVSLSKGEAKVQYSGFCVLFLNSKCKTYTHLFITKFIIILSLSDLDILNMYYEREVNLTCNICSD